MTTTLSFGARTFGSVDLGDQRRTARLAQLADALCRHPGGTLPDKLSRPADLRAFYQLMNRRPVTHARLLHAHADETRQRLAALDSGVALILHDATELDYTTKATLLPHLGQIGQGTRRGYICHNSLAVRADTGETLGLVSQILHHRADVPKNETLAQSRQRLDRESRLWVHGAQASGPAPADVRCIDVSDSLSDTFEYMAYEHTQQREFVLRSRENRGLQTPIAGQEYLWDAVRQLPSQGQRPLTVLASSGRTARTTTVEVAFTAVTLALPSKAQGEYPKKPLAVWAVRVWEPNTPRGEDLLEWILLTNVPVTGVAEAYERIDWYEKRPIIEELHKAMKTGCRIEDMQFTTIQRLEPAIAVLSAVATTLLRLRDAARAPDGATRPATAVVTAEYVEVLTRHYPKRIKKAPSVHTFYLHVARLGGHQNRKADGFPGWITLWRGWMKLQCMVDGWRAAHLKTKVSSGKS